MASRIPPTCGEMRHGTALPAHLATLPFPVSQARLPAPPGAMQHNIDFLHTTLHYHFPKNTLTAYSADQVCMLESPTGYEVYYEPRVMQ